MRKTSTEVAAPDEAPCGYRLEDQVGFLLRLAYQRASANLLSKIGGLDLTPPQFAVLATLYREGLLSQNKLGRLVAMEPANIRDVVRRLLLRGLVATAHDARDRRLLNVRLSPAGRAFVKPLLVLDTEASALTLSALTPAEGQILCDLLRRVASGTRPGGSLE